jgi:hypothetical protein
LDRHLRLRLVGPDELFGVFNETILNEHLISRWDSPTVRGVMWRSATPWMRPKA